MIGVAPSGGGRSLEPDTGKPDPDQPVANTPRRLLGGVFAIGASVAFIALLAYGLLAAAPDDSIDQDLADGM